MDKTQKRTDHFEDIKTIISEADRICDMEGRCEFFSEQADSIRESLVSLRTADVIRYGVMLRILSQEIINDSPVPPVSLIPSKEICQELRDNKVKLAEKAAELNFQRAKALYEHVGERKHKGKYTDQHRLIESAINLVWKEFDSQNRWPHAETISEKKAYSFIADCYLLRSKLALTKGADIPEKKVEAIENAWNWADRASDQMDGLKMKIALERDRWDKNLECRWIQGCIERFLENQNHIFDARNPLHWMVNNWLSSHMLQKKQVLQYREAADKEILEHDITKKKNRFYPLCQAWAAFRLKMDNISEKLEKAVASLEGVPLSAPLWNDTVDLIKKLSETDEYKGKWEDAAIAAWRKCQETERRIRLSIQVRWYWAGYRKLYDLAFHAALHKAVSDNAERFLAIEITDSLKSRPTIKMQDLERSLKGDDTERFRRLVEAEAGAYVHDIEELKKISLSEDREQRDFHKLPEGWAAVHFNVLDKSRGYALIVEKGKCHPAVPLSLSDVWDAFREWDAEWRNFDIRDTNSLLQTLCRKSGEMLRPALEMIRSENILFIPHGFLHLVPIHASILDNGNHLFEEKSCLFLPSWSIIPPETDETLVSRNENDILVTNWKRCHEIELILREDWRNHEITDNTPEDIFVELAKEVPRFLVIFSHGQSDAVNPYQSKLLMRDRPLTHQELVQKLPSLNGVRVILTACESDLVSGKLGPIDEHLSLASAFLSKGASEVVAALYPCATDISQELILNSKQNPQKPLHRILKDKQEDWIGKGENKKRKQFYKIPVFRVMGFPMK